MIKCREVPHALQDRQLPWHQKLGLHLHLLICPPCRALKRQWEQLERHMKRWLDRQPKPDAKLAEKIARQYLD